MATLDRSKPDASAWIWHDATTIYIQLPNSTYIDRFPKTEGGLHRALKLIPLGKPSTVSNVLKPSRFSESLQRSVSESVRRLKP